MVAPKTQTVPRPPIVVVMGHIDHGKSTLLDTIRKTNVVATESGGITQHMSAYEVEHETPDGVRRITFLDTPGHEAFQGMRERGAKVADIAILVVSAEDGVKAQTLEALAAIKTAGIPFIVAINKVDKPNANIERTKQTLAEHEVLVEGWGGDIPAVPISAKQGTGISDLLDTLLIVAEMEQLTDDTKRASEGVVIEANMDPRKGITATVVITNGEIEKGGFAVAEDAIAPLRLIEDFRGVAQDRMTASSPMRITGWSSLPPTGSLVHVFSTRKDAERSIAERKTETTKTAPKDAQKPTKDAVFALILKTDVAGTLEAVEHELAKISVPNIVLRVVQRGLGAISENDVKTASGTEGAAVVSFRAKTDPLAADLALRNKVTIKTFDVIYELSEWVEGEMRRTAPKFEVPEEIGALKVIRIFSEQKEKRVLGGRVERGVIAMGAKVKILRRDVEIGEGKIVELQSQKIRTDSVSEGTECGLMVESKMTIAERDTLVAYTLVVK